MKDDKSAHIFLKTRLAKFGRQLPYFLRTLGIVRSAAMRWTVAWGFLLLLQGILPVASVYLIRAFVDTLASVVRNGEPKDIRMVFLLVVSLALVQLLSEFFRVTITWIRTTVSELVHDHIIALIHRKSASVDLAFYESPDFYDHLHRARTDADYRSILLLESAGSLMQNCFTLLAMAVVLIGFGLWLPAALILSTLPALYIGIVYTERHHQWRFRNASNERWTWYYSWVLTTGETATELRLFHLADFFRSAHETLRGKLRSERLALLKNERTGELFAGLTAYLISGVSLAWMVWKTIRGLLSLGDLAMFYQAFHQGQQLMRSLLVNFRQVYENSLFLGNLYEFLDLPSQIVSPSDPVSMPAELKAGIRFNHVHFCYPGSDRKALQDFNLTIPAGQIAAIVGPNGAGKSTLVKLLCRFYDPVAGEIDIDGIDLRRLDLDGLRRSITVLFQQPVRYIATAAENIAFGDLQSKPDQQAIKTAAVGAGAEEIILRLPQEYETLLGKWFANGTELSVGEWQRLALARAFLRQARIVLLDEPTSAMDSWAEADWMGRFRNLIHGRTAIVITHRFTTAMQADVIHVIQNGRIMESGSHESLLALGGQYARSWTAQARSRTQPA